MGNSEDAVSVAELTKTYPGGVEAVRGLSFGVRTGEIFGLLGPNGAGKTTTVGVLTTLVRPTSGFAMVGGHDVRTEPLEVRRSIGVVFQDSVLDNDFSGAENLRLHARLWRIPDAKRRIESLVAAVGLSERIDDVVWTYSGGMRRRLEIARRDLWRVVRALRERHGVTIVLSTHYLEEAQDVCDRVAIIDKGQIVAEGTPASLVARFGAEVADLSLDGDDATELIAALDGHPGHLIQAGSSVSIVSRESRQALTNRINALPLSEIGVSTITVRPTTLNDVFLQLTAGGDEPDLVGATRSREP